MGLFSRIRSTKRPEPRQDRAVALSPAMTEWGPDGARITFPEDLWEALQSGTASTAAREQRVALAMLTEQGLAEHIGNSYHLPTNTVSRLSDEDARALGLPSFCRSPFITTITGNTTVIGNSPARRFEVRIDVEKDGRPLPIRREGAIITIGTGKYEERYRLSAPMVKALDAIDEHSASGRSEHENVQLVAALQTAQKEAESFPLIGSEDEDDQTQPAPGFPLDLKVLEKFTTHVPEKVRITAESQADGSLHLTPDLGSEHTPEELAGRWHQLRATPSGEGGVLRVNNTLISLAPELVEGVRAVHRKPRIPAEEVPDFLKAPGDFLGDVTNIDTEKLNVRVRAIGAIEPMTFSLAESTSLEWFASAEETLEPEELPDLIDTPEQLKEFEDLIERTWEQGGTVIPYDDDRLISIKDEPRVRKALKKARDKLRDITPGSGSRESQVSVGFLLKESSEATTPSLTGDKTPAVDYSRLKFLPFTYQKEGIEWLASRMRRSLDGSIDSPERVQGALLADDMGLGKTFMTLVALRQFTQEIIAKNPSAENPHLLVVPLTLVDNWRMEMEKLFTEAPFDDVFVLHGEGLKKHRVQGAGRETLVSSSKLQDDLTVDTSNLRQSLIVGERYGNARLDKPGRLIITTYETLASYQLSLGQVEWGAVIFDEAQDIKNPDALRTRAAKGLKARFKLVATGTPVENSLRDFWCLMDTAQPGFLGNWGEFKQQWHKPMSNAPAAEQAELGKRLADITRPLMLRRNKEDHLKEHLPAKTIHSGGELTVTMPPKQATAYSKTLSGHRARSGKPGAALKTLGALKTISLHPDAASHGTPDSGNWKDAARLQAIMPVIDRIRDRDEKVIIFLINKKIQRRLALWLEERYGFQVHILNGDTSTSGTGSSPTRSGLIDSFQSTPGFNIIIMSPVAAGRGLTVTEANHAIHLERHWNPAKEAQATDRVYRIGQKRRVHVYLPRATHPDPNIRSFDENLSDLLAQKSLLKDAVVVPPQVDETELATSMGLK